MSGVPGRGRRQVAASPGVREARFRSPASWIGMTRLALGGGNAEGLRARRFDAEGAVGQVLAAMSQPRP
jgi:hypothetical protein